LASDEYFVVFDEAAASGVMSEQLVEIQVIVKVRG
jgi:hypothetical protein